MPRTPITKELVSQLRYDPETGEFFWLRNGLAAGSVYKNGYVYIKIGGQRYLAHRLAYFICNGELPEQVDHINWKRSDNRQANLRASNASENQQNLHGPRDGNELGILGVSRHGKRFRAFLRVDGALVHRSSHETPEAAEAAYLSAKAEHHPASMIHGDRQ